MTDETTPPTDPEQRAAPHAPSFERGDHAELAEQLIDQLMSGDHCDAPVAFDLGDFWQYATARGVWETLPTARLECMVQDFAGEFVHPGGEGKPYPLKVRRSDVVGTLECAKARPFAWGMGEGYFEDAPRGLAFSDGFLPVLEDDTGRPYLADLTPHAPENRARVGFDFPLASSPTCPLFEGYLGSLWEGEPDGAERVRLLQQVTGVALLEYGTRYKRALMLYGEKGTGKSTFLDILLSLFPAGSVASVGPQHWGDFNLLAGLIGARINAVHELAPEHIKAQARAKEVMDGAPLTIHEKYRNRVTFTPRALHIFAANELPPVPGAHDSFWDRWMILELTRQFRGTAGEVKDLGKNIAQHERAGIVRWALEGARQVFEQDGYSVPESSRALLAQWGHEADSVARFAHHELEPLPASAPHSHGLTDEELFADPVRGYMSWCARKNLKSCSEPEFARRIKNAGLGKKQKSGSRRPWRVQWSTDDEPSHLSRVV